jgi:hypothetical protein
MDTVTAELADLMKAMPDRARDILAARALYIDWRTGDEPPAPETTGEQPVSLEDLL